MKTKFFKKLSFVLVVAMVLSVLTPAAGVFAAKKPKLNATSKYLHLGVDGKDEFDFNISNKKSGWKYDWESANEDVVTVDKKGVVTAAGVGKTKVTVYITDKDGEEVTSLSATVTVRDNIKEVKISNAPEGKIAVGKEYDFNRSFVTVSGSTKKTSSITRWEVSPEGATINDKGLFTATKAGKYTVTARAFQSDAKYQSWLKDKETYKDYVLDDDSVEVTVEASIVGIKQINKNSFTVEFDSSMKDTDLSATNAMVYQVINGKLYNTGTEKIKSLTLDETGKVATVETYGNFVSKGSYQFTYGDMNGLFTAADTSHSEIAGIVFDDFQVKTNDYVDMRDHVKAVNKDGVVILDGQDIAPYLTFEYKGEYTHGWTDGYNLYINKDGFTAKVLAKYNNYVYDEESKTYKNIEFQDEAVAIGLDSIVDKTSLQFALTSSGSAPDVNDNSKWATSGFTVAAGDEDYKVYTRYKKNTDPSWAGFTLAGDTEFIYDTTNSDKLVIYGNALYPFNTGVVTVLVKENNEKKTVIGSFDVTIVSTRAYVAPTVENNTVSLGNKDFGPGLTQHNESKTVTIVNKDSVGAPVTPSATYEVVNRSQYWSSGNAEPGVSFSYGSGANAGKTYATVTAPGVPKGTYRIKVSLTAYNTTHAVYIYVNVLDSSNATATRWQVELSDSEVDLYGVDDDVNVGINVYGYNVNGARVAVAESSNYSVTVKRADNGVAIKYGATSTNIPIAIVSGSAVTATGSAINMVDLTTYLVNAKVTTADSTVNRPVGADLGTVSLTVKDTTEVKPQRTKTTVNHNKGTVANAIFDAFDFYLDGKKIDETTDAGSFRFKYTKGGRLSDKVVGGDGIVAGENIYIYEVYYETTWGNGNYVTYTFKVGQSITID